MMHCAGLTPSTRSTPLIVKQVFALPFLWVLIAGISGLAYPILAWPSGCLVLVCFYWAVRAAFFSEHYTYVLDGRLVFGGLLAIAFIGLACAGLAEEFLHISRANSYLAAPVGLLYLTAWFAAFYAYERRAVWRDFQTTRENRYLSAVDGEVVWRTQGRPASPSLISLATGGGIAFITVAGAFVGRERAQAIAAAICVVIVPVILSAFGTRAIVGLIELRKLERAHNARFPLPNIEEVRLGRAASWIGRLINPELRAIHRTAERGEMPGNVRAYRTRK